MDKIKLDFLTITRRFDLASLPADEHVVGIAQGGEALIIINHKRKDKKVKLPWKASEHLTGCDTRELKLEPYGVAIVTRIDQNCL